MKRSVVIDYLPESASRYRPGWAVVAVDVIRATTTAISAVAAGWRCLPVPDVQTALALARGLKNPLLAGETAGAVPQAFEMDNSPAELAGRTDNYRPLVLVSSSGTRLIHEAASSEALYLACFRNYSALAEYLAGHHSRIAVIGAGSKGEFREEDQICCAWIAAELMSRGYDAENAETAAIVARWRNADAHACLCSHSVDFLRRADHLPDLDFILSHIDDLAAVFAVRNGEVQMIPAVASATARPWMHARAGCRQRSVWSQE